MAKSGRKRRIATETRCARRNGNRIERRGGVSWCSKWVLSGKKSTPRLSFRRFIFLFTKRDESEIHLLYCFSFFGNGRLATSGAKLCNRTRSNEAFLSSSFTTRLEAFPENCPLPSLGEFEVGRSTSDSPFGLSGKRDSGRSGFHGGQRIPLYPLRLVNIVTSNIA